jgi:hypothetical protein
MRPLVTTLNAELAETAWFDKLTMSAHPERFDSPLTLSPSKSEHPAQDRRVEGCLFGGFRVDPRGVPWNA